MPKRVKRSCLTAARVTEPSSAHGASGVRHVIHETQLVRDLLQHMGGKIRSRFPPPRGPNGSRIERLRPDLHADVTDIHRSRTMGAFPANVLRGLEARFSIAEEQALAS